MTEKQLTQATWILFVILLALIITVKCAPREKVKHNEPKQGLTFETDSLPMYKYPSGHTGSLERDFETGQKGILIQ